MPKHLSEDIRKAIVATVEARIKRYDIQNTFNVLAGAISEILKRKRERGSLKTERVTGRPRKTSEKQIGGLCVKRRLIRSRHQRPSIGNLEKTIFLLLDGVFQLLFSGIYVDDSAVRRRLREGGLFGRMAVKKPFVWPKNRKARLKFAKNYID
uniref:Paired domain-containing protein n=1 Tax=Ditylenchus dipsaci TaxID=166011 RepID=A0A915DGY2_9BILA